MFALLLKFCVCFGVCLLVLFSFFLWFCLLWYNSWYFPLLPIWNGSVCVRGPKLKSLPLVSEEIFTQKFEQC